MSKVFYFLCNLSQHTFSTQPEDPSAATHQPCSFKMSLILGEGGQSMKLTSVTVKDSQCNHGIRTVRALPLVYTSCIQGAERSRLI